MALHSEYVNTQIATLTDQAKELSKRATKMTGQSTPALICGRQMDVLRRHQSRKRSAVVYLCSAIFLLQCIKNGSIGVGHSPPAHVMDVGVWRFSK